MKVLTSFEDILKQKCKPVEHFDIELADLCNKMIALMKSKNAAGLAANQVGVNLRVFVMQLKDTAEAMVNPEILEATGKVKYNEGCLSFPGKYFKIKRKSFVKLRYKNINGVTCEMLFNGYEAACVQHEIDHLNGITMGDRFYGLVN